MRLTTYQQETIPIVIGKYLENISAELRLHGSRTDDSKKGGDIDLLLIIDDSKLVDQIKNTKLDIVLALNEAIGEQKIDLIITDNLSLSSDPFLKMVYPSSLLLQRFGS